MGQPGRITGSWWQALHPDPRAGSVDRITAPGDDRAVGTPSRLTVIGDAAYDRPPVMGPGGRLVMEYGSVLAELLGAPGPEGGPRDLRPAAQATSRPASTAEPP
jgi:2-polyprenyl-6-methoxyphenol hydroxylase-like FAD-dependent oxidoreductase